MILRKLARQAFGHSIRHVIGILHRFNAHDVTAGKGVGVRRAITNGKDIRQRCPAIGIDINPCTASCARIEQRRDGGNDTDADNDHLRGDHLTIGQANAGDVAITLNSSNFNAQANVDAMRAMLSFVKA